MTAGKGAGPPGGSGARPVRVVLDMQDRRPAWAMPSWVADRVRDALPPGSDLVVMEVPADGSGDGVARVHPAVLEAVEDADAYLGLGIPAEVLGRGRRLAWVHTGVAGVGGSLTPEMRGADVVFTNSAGIHGPPMAETVVAMLLHFFRGLDFAVHAQARGQWDVDPFLEAGTPVRELSRSTVGVVGFGGVGREVGRRCAALGARVLGLVRSPPEREETALATVSGDATMGAAARTLAGPEGLELLLAESDAVVLCVPETDATRGLIGADALARMRPSAVLVNVGRGRLLDEDALVDALRGGRLRGAALDVFATEPLPGGHPLWSAPRALLTPHVSAVSDAYWERETELITDNVARWVAGEPLRNVVDRDAGY